MKIIYLQLRVITDSVTENSLVTIANLFHGLVLKIQDEYFSYSLKYLNLNKFIRKVQICAALQKVKSELITYSQNICIKILNEELKHFLEDETM